MNHTQVYDVQTDQVAQSWSINLDGYSVDDLQAGEEFERKLTLRAPSKGSEAPAGQVVRATVFAVSKHDSTQTDEITVYATLTRKYKVELVVSPLFLEMDPAENTMAVFDLNITNSGNGPDYVSISVTDITLDVVSTDMESAVQLDMGESTTSTLILNIDSNHAQGLYSLMVHISSEDGSSTASKQLAVQIVRPDLSISENDIDVPPDIPALYDTMTITAKIRNNGTAPARGVVVSLMGDGGSADTEIIDLIPELGSESIELSILLSSPGTYNLKVVIDPDDVIIESNEDNNEVAFSFAIYPDLTFVGNLEMDQYNPREGTKVTFTVTIKNQGEVSVDSDFEVEFYYYKAGQRTSIVKLDITDVLDVGDTKALSAEWTARQGITTIYCMVDSSRNIYERDETNNDIKINLSVRQALPDEAEEGGTNLFLVAGVIFIIIVLIILYMMFMPPQGEYEDEEDERVEDKDKEKKGKAPAGKPGTEKAKGAAEKKAEKGEKPTGKGAREIPSERPKEVGKAKAEEVEEEADEDEPEGIGGALTRGIEGIIPFGKLKKRKVRKKIKRRTGVSVTGERDVKDKKEREDDTLAKIRKAETLLKERELREKEARLERRSQRLREREREIRTMKDDLVEIGILEADVIDELEKEEVVVVEEEEDESDAVEVEPID
ncbi:MAG: hypothetical protein JSV49_05135 [Thermoplasmata archaeon]|nr:MAG: hypothetical protein JSV49_05135 [Thermoplasmata archaeon]